MVKGVCSRSVFLFWGVLGTGGVLPTEKRPESPGGAGQGGKETNFLGKEVARVETPD